MPDQPKFKRKHFFINRRLQIRYMISLLIPMLILIVFIGLVMYYSQYRFLQATTREMGKDLKEILRTNQMYIEDESTRNAKSVGEIRNRLNQYLVGDSAFSASLLKTAYRILFIGLMVVVIELAFLTIFISHKVAGPVYRFMKFSEDLQEGRFAAKIYLRQGDELMELASALNRAGDVVCENFREALRLNDEAIAILESGRPADPDKLALLKRGAGEIRKKIRVEA